MSKRILIIEEDSTLKLYLQQIVDALDQQRQKTEIAWRTSADEVVEELKAQPRLSPTPSYDLIISEITPSGNLSGYDVWKVCKSKFPNTEVVLTAGGTVLEFLRKVCPTVPPLFAPKPLNLHECRQVIHRLLGNKIN